MIYIDSSRNKKWAGADESAKCWQTAKCNYQTNCISESRQSLLAAGIK